MCLPDVTKKAKEIPKGTDRRPRETSVFDRVLSSDLPYRICQEPSATTFHPFSLSLIFQSFEFFFSFCFYSSSCPCRPTYSSEECDREMRTRVYRSKELEDEHRGADAILRSDRRWRFARVCGSNLSGKFGNGLLFSEGELRFVSIPTVVSSGACTCRCSCFSTVSRTLIHSNNNDTNLFDFVLAAEEYDLVAIFPTARFHVRSSRLSFLRFIRTLLLTRLLYYALRVYARSSFLKLSFPSAL